MRSLPPPPPGIDEAPLATIEGARGGSRGSASQLSLAVAAGDAPLRRVAALPPPALRDARARFVAALRLFVACTAEGARAEDRLAEFRTALGEG